MSQLRTGKLLHGFRMKKSFEIPEFRLIAAELIHEKTNAKYWHLRREDPNKTFRQEGWRLEPKNLVDRASDLQIKGVVFNEMKGVFSNSINRFGQTVQNSLLPQTYGFISGGHPEKIPSLTWEALKKYHGSCYHPSNACFYTYGDVDLDWSLEFLNKEYLQSHEALHLDNEIPLEPVWDKPRTVELSCEPDPMCPDPARQCTVALSYRLEDVRQVYTNFVLNIVTKLLMDGDNAPLYRGLIESGYGLDWVGGVCGLDQGARTTSLHVGVQGVRSEEVDQFVDLTRQLLMRVVSDGFAKERIDATLHQYELGVRHDSARFGLHLIFGLSHAVNHEVDVEEFLGVQNLLQRFREDLAQNPHLLQDMVQRYLLDNKHTLFTTMKPSESYQSTELQRVAELERGVVSAVSSTDREAWITKSQTLSEKQQVEEDVSCLPSLQLVDIPLECRPEPFTLTQAHRFAMQRAAAQLSSTHRLRELWSGLEQASLVKRTATALGAEGQDAASSALAETALDTFTDNMMRIWEWVRERSRMQFSLHAESEGLTLGETQLEQFVTSLPMQEQQLELDGLPSTTVDPFGQLPKLPVDSYFVMPYTVHYSSQALPAPSYDSEDFATEKGGAYGGRAVANPGAFMFFSYRDPHARQTLKHFQDSLTWAQTTELNAQDIEESQLAVFQELDQPVSAGSRGLRHFLHCIDDEHRQQHRSQLFTVSAEKLRIAATKLAQSIKEGRSSRAVLGPETSTDWDASVGEWTRVDMRD